MKSIIISFFIILLSSSIYGQVILSEDEAARKSAMVNYLDQCQFDYETPVGDAASNLIINSFKTSLIIPAFTQLEGISETDLLKIESLKLALKTIIDSPTPSWDTILMFETQKMLLLDKQLRRQSKYKN